jgi:polyhydroxybutyrate depolymerase
MTRGAAIWRCHAWSQPFFLLPLLLALLFVPVWPERVKAQGCGEQQACMVGLGSYLYRPPKGFDGARPRAALVYFHGFRSSAEEVLADAALKDLLDRRGMALVAPQGLVQTWSHPGSPAQVRDEFTFTEQVLEDALHRFSLRKDAVIASGFSQGGSMVWYLACRLGQRFAGFVPMAGAFWRPHPQECLDGPKPLYHLHGLSDPVVPMMGRPIRGGAFHQGDVREAIAFLVRTNRCLAEPRREVRSPVIACDTYVACSGGHVVSLCTHPGDHAPDMAWLGGNIDRILAETLEKP